MKQLLSEDTLELFNFLISLPDSIPVVVQCGDFGPYNDYKYFGEPIDDSEDGDWWKDKINLFPGKKKMTLKRFLNIMKKYLDKKWTTGDFDQVKSITLIENKQESIAYANLAGDLISDRKSPLEDVCDIPNITYPFVVIDCLKMEKLNNIDISTNNDNLIKSFFKKFNKGQ